MAKRKFTFEPFPQSKNAPAPLCDVYCRGVKVLSGHNASLGHVYLPVTDSVTDVDVQIKPHDPREPLARKEDEQGNLVLPEPKRLTTKTTK